MGACFLYGTGGGKRYRVSEVYGGQNPPAVGVKEGDIFLRTNVAISGGEISANIGGMPTWEVPDGTWYIAMTTGVFPDNSRSAYFVWDTQKAHSVSGYPGQAYVRENGQWRRCEGYIFHNNGWLMFSSAWSGQLFDNGEQYTGVTGGWVGNGIGSTSVGSSLSLIVSNSSPYLTTQNAVDLSGYSQLHIIADKNAGQYSYFGISRNVPSNARPDYIASAMFNGGENVLDISAISSGHISIGATASWGVTINISKVWLT